MIRRTSRCMVRVFSGSRCAIEGHDELGSEGGSQTGCVGGIPGPIRIEHSLNILNMFRNKGPGSLSLTTTWNSRSCTISYTPTKCSGISPRASSWRIVTFDGSHCSCGQSAMSRSKPSSWAVGGEIRARSRSQILN